MVVNDDELEKMQDVSKDSEASVSDSSNELGGDQVDAKASVGSEAPMSEEKSVDQRVKEAEDKVLRMAAEFENTKKRLRQRSDEMVKYANEKLIMDFLPVIDDLDRAIASLDDHEAQSTQEGLRMVQKMFHKILEQNGVEEIKALNQPFDPNLHEAVGEVENSQVEEGSIVEEVQKGYTLHGRLARPSRVRIAKKA